MSDVFISSLNHSFIETEIVVRTVSAQILLGSHGESVEACSGYVHLDNAASYGFSEIVITDAVVE